MRIWKTKWIFILVILLAVIVAFSACSNATDAPGSGESKKDLGDESVITLKVADSVPPSHYISTQGIRFWMKRVEELTGNKVNFEYYPGEQMGKAKSLLDLTKSKAIDIGYITYAMDKMPLSRVVELPSAFESSTQGSKAYWKLVNEVLLEEEFLKNGVRPLWAAVSPQYQVLTTKKKIEHVDDFKGLKIRSTGADSLDMTIRALGATPVSIPAPELYTALERGTVDGTLFPITSYEPYQLEKIGKYSTSNARFGSAVFLYAINEEVFQGLPDSVKEAMIQAGNETVEHFSKFLDQEVKSLIEKFRGEGLEVYELSEDALKEIDQKVSPVWDDWAKKHEANGITGIQLVEKYMEFRDSQ